MVNMVLFAAISISFLIGLVIGICIGGCLVWINFQRERNNDEDEVDHENAL